MPTSWAYYVFKHKFQQFHPETGCANNYMSHSEQCRTNIICIYIYTSKIIGGFPTRAMAVLSFLLLPPLQKLQHCNITLSRLYFYVGILKEVVSTHLYVPQRLSACLARSSLLTSMSTTSLICCSGMPRRRANIVRSSLPVSLSNRASN